MPDLALAVDVDAPPEVTFAAMTDWDRQHEWMLGTSVRATHNGGHGLGGRFEAFTGRRPLGFNDPMEITAWDPPYRCDVRHLGSVVRGTGTFAVEPLPGGRSRFVWREDIELPLGLLGRLGWPLVRPAFTAGLRLSLDRFARWAPAH